MKKCLGLFCLTGFLFTLEDSLYHVSIIKILCNGYFCSLHSL